MERAFWQHTIFHIKGWMWSARYGYSEGGRQSVSRERLFSKGMSCQQAFFRFSLLYFILLVCFENYLIFIQYKKGNHTSGFFSETIVVPTLAEICQWRENKAKLKKSLLF